MMGLEVRRGMVGEKEVEHTYGKNLGDGKLVGWKVYPS